MLPSSNIKVSDAAPAKNILNLVSALEDLDDIQSVYANFDISDDLMKEMEG